jgi:CRISPR/Cas system-associated protein Cas5 (RAMP superfamily)
MFTIIRRLWIYVGLSISRMYVDNRIARIYAGTNEIMKIVSLADYLRTIKKMKEIVENYEVVSVVKVQWGDMDACNTLTMWYMFDGEKQPGSIILERLDSFPLKGRNENRYYFRFPIG